MRRRGYKTHQAEDYTQAFFTRLLDKKGLRLADPKQGKFRSFLLFALKYFLANELNRIRARKRGGGRKVLSLDFESAEGKYALEPADRLSPDKLFERSWALTVLERAMERLQAEASGTHKQRLFKHLKGYLTAERSSVPYRDVAERRYRELLRDEIAQTVTSEEQIDEEIRALFAALAH